MKVTGVESPSASMVEEKEDRLEAAPTPQEEVVMKKELVTAGEPTIGGGADAAEEELVTAGEPTIGGGADAANEGGEDGGGAETAGE